MELNKWIEKYEPGLARGGRDKTMYRALELLLGKTDPIIVETGTTRMPDDWGAGMATLVFGDFCKEFGAHLFTVDIDHGVLEVSKEVTKDFAVFITYVENDSVEFLEKFNQKIDLLYLDSMDCPEYDSPVSLNLIKSQAHQWFEMEAALDKLADNPIILLDDNLFDNGGKTKLTKLYLVQEGFKEIMGGKQSLWVR